MLIKSVRVTPIAIKDPPLLNAAGVHEPWGLRTIIEVEGVNGLVGIFSERDYARKVALKGKSSSDALVSEIMTSRVITIHTRHTIDQCMQIMTDNHIRHLPIVNDQKVMGLISIGDVVREMIASQKSMIDQLQSYIAG